MDPDQGISIFRAIHGIIDIPSVWELELLGHGLDFPIIFLSTNTAVVEVTYILRHTELTVVIPPSVSTCCSESSASPQWSPGRIHRHYPSA